MKSRCVTCVCACGGDDGNALVYRVKIYKNENYAVAQS